MSVIKGTKEIFQEEVLDSKEKVLVDFYADWCGPCRMLSPIVEDISKEKKSMKFYSINVDEEEDLARTYHIFTIPCLILFENGKELKRNVGMISKSDLVKFIDE